MTVIYTSGWLGSILPCDRFILRLDSSILFIHTLPSSSFHDLPDLFMSKYIFFIHSTILDDKIIYMTQYENCL
ncbi:hypothetical protein MA16_Dca002525 [Dendrobium catenatum]|uniref:Uncharacterized protein n=1 Tax=Dendrobium catenatum TaxID=906689 RepID=A0A2I0W0R4_9ASPA|nr:hypothetical protein MA16_Dca002525 [Dendrobium catenatum]